jgi:hypothetical protein
MPLIRCSNPTSALHNQYARIDEASPKEAGLRGCDFLTSLEQTRRCARHTVLSQSLGRFLDSTRPEAICHAGQFAARNSALYSPSAAARGARALEALDSSISHEADMTVASTTTPRSEPILFVNMMSTPSRTRPRTEGARPSPATGPRTTEHEHSTSLYGSPPSWRSFRTRPASDCLRLSTRHGRGRSRVKEELATKASVLFAPLCTVAHRPT